VWHSRRLRGHDLPSLARQLPKGSDQPRRVERLAHRRPRLALKIWRRAVQVEELGQRRQLLARHSCQPLRRLVPPLAAQPPAKSLLARKEQQALVSRGHEVGVPLAERCREADDGVRVRRSHEPAAL